MTRAAAIVAEDILAHLALHHRAQLQRMDHGIWHEIMELLPVPVQEGCKVCLHPVLVSEHLIHKIW